MNNKGFTLVELSIVLVIIGLIVAGVVAGQSLIKQAQLRSVMTEADAVRAAVNAFKLEYNGLPGDISNGSSYWATGCNAAGSGASVAADCDGDNNKRILMAAGNTGESYMAWYHLSRASLYPGTFVAGAVITGALGINIPKSKFSKAGITLVFDDSSSDATAGNGATSNGRDLNRNVILFGGVVSANIANGLVFSTAQAASIDGKADDGIGTTGKVVGTGTTVDGVGTCLSGTAYNLDATAATPCALAFLLD